MFGNLTKHIKEEVIGKAIDKLGRSGKASMDGVGNLYYDPKTDVLSMSVDPQMKEKVKKSWEHYHRNTNYE